MLTPYAIASFVFYSLGVPVLFAAVLYRHRVAINADQELRRLGMGDSEKSNPQFSTRKRYQELYNLFRPGMGWWRLHLLVRKFAVVTIGLMFANNPLFQARCDAA